MIDQPAHFTGPVLAGAIDLNRHVITVQRGIAIAGLHRAANAEIERQADHRRTRRHLAERVVGRSIIDHQHIKVGQRAMQAMGEFADGLPFIERRHNHQAA